MRFNLIASCSRSGFRVSTTGEQEQASAFWHEPRATALLVLANGMAIEGFGLGFTGAAVGEVCFNTAMTGYQEILTDPSYAGQIVTFTFPHIGNTGVNDEDIETSNLAASAGVRGIIVHAPVTGPSNHRANGDFNTWLKRRGIVGLYGLDTRALTAFIRENGMPNAVIAHSASGDFDIDGLRTMAREWPGLEDMDLVPEVTAAQRYDWTQAAWVPGQGFRAAGPGTYKVVAIDYGIKRNILRLLTEAGCAVTVVPAQTPADSILAMRPDGVFLSNGPGDPAETG
ncbi:MAG: carbamoyl phosphate synthase small subunit, partial [Hyphomicrobiales bacterium]